MAERTELAMDGAQDPRFWRAAAISTTAVMFIVLILLTDSLGVIRAGGANVPAYTVINQAVGYQFDTDNNTWVPTIGEQHLLFGHKYDAAEAEAGSDS